MQLRVAQLKDTSLHSLVHLQGPYWLRLIASHAPWICICIQKCRVHSVWKFLFLAECVYDRFMLMAAVHHSHKLLLYSGSPNLVPVSCWRWDKVVCEWGVKLQLNFLIAVSTGEPLRNRARPFVFGATSALSSPVCFMLSLLFSPYKKVNVCLYIIMFTDDIWKEGQKCFNSWK